LYFLWTGEACSNSSADTVAMQIYRGGEEERKREEVERGKEG